MAVAFFAFFFSVWALVEVLHLHSVERALQFSWAQESPGAAPESGPLQWIYLIEDADRTALDARLRFGGQTSIGSRASLSGGVHRYIHTLGFSVWVGLGYVWNIEIPYWFLLLVPGAGAGYCWWRLKAK